ncbi:mucoidy inhibitor MuiA family protein [Myxococcaceae bacterium JPH2]|nr:mucoidy inhibitor MuiA family protein [Myxococcaceae bacterium JPH2]
MLSFGIGLIAASVLGTATDAPITAVTVYGDRARVVRTATVNLSGTQHVDFPLLTAPLDLDSVHVEARGADVSRVEVRRVNMGAFSEEAARKLLASMERVERLQVRNRDETDAYRAQLAAIRGIQPTPLGAKESPGASASTARGDPTAWSTATTFLGDTTAKLNARLRELERQAATLTEEAKGLQRQAAEFALAPSHSAVKVAATLAGTGSAELRLAYVTRDARWTPAYELRLDPDGQRVRVALQAQVSQETSEDWESAALTLSTANPATTQPLPRLATWSIGSTERFIPTPVSTGAPLPPQPTTPVRESTLSEEAVLRQELLTRAGTSAAPGAKPTPLAVAQTPRPPPANPPVGEGSFVGTITSAESRKPLRDVVVSATSSSLESERDTVTDTQGRYSLAHLPPGTYTLRFESESLRPYARADIALRAGSSLMVNVEMLPDSFTQIVVTAVSATEAPTPGPQLRMAAPVGTWQPPLNPHSPAALAGGYDLTFSARARETIRSGQGSRAIPLFDDTWPVDVRRVAFPALSSETYLVADLKGPATGILPSGAATLAVGDDPAGTAQLDLVMPGQPFTLPLGMDRAVRTARNVRVAQSEKGFLGKDEVATYEVFIEVPNPYHSPLRVRVVDQLPLNTDGNVQVELLRSEPVARQESSTGVLQWEMVVPASSKSTVSFQYSLSRPKGWRLQQLP